MDFRPDIEGLRAVAILAVVAFHADIPGVTGGFIGVDVFFVISGFLITRLLWSEVSRTGGVNLASFYGARVRRLLPAAGTVLVVTAGAAAILLPPLQARSVLGDGLASALYVGNYRFAAHDTDYLADTLPSPFQHYWSLGVEEQFYLLWPALILGTAWLLHRRRRETRRSTTAPFLPALLAVAVASLALALIVTRTSPPWAFFSLPTRAWELAAGGVVALTASTWRRLPPGPAAVAGLGGLALVVGTCLQLNEQTPYPGTAALLPVLGTALVIGAGCARPGAWLSLPWLRAVGRLSYSWYLWHWPLLIFAPVLVGHPLGLAGHLLAVSASFALAVLTLRYVERPVRYSIPLRRSAGRSLALGSVITAAAVCAALLLPMFVPATVGSGDPAAAAMVHDSGRRTAVSADPLADAVAGVQAVVAASAGQRAVPSNLSPPLAEAAADKPSVFVDGCVRSWRDVGVPECASGDPASRTTVALVGDSHAAMWYPALAPIAAQRHWRLETMAKITCPLQNLKITSPYLGREYTECERWRVQTLGRLRAERPRLVVLSMSRRYGADFGFTSYDPAWVESLRQLVSQLRLTTGARVLVLGPVPDPHSTVPVCLSGHLNDATACSAAPSVALNANGIAAESAATRTGGGQYADLSPLFCTEQLCPVVVGPNLVFRDDNHITIPYAQALGPVLAMLTDEAMAPRS